MKDIEENLDKLRLVIQKHEEIFNEIIENYNRRRAVIPEEIFITLMVFRKIVEKLDAIFILLENKSENAAKSISRDLIENFLYFSFIIETKDKYKIRALSYYFSNFKDQISLSKLLRTKNHRGIKIREFLDIKADNKGLVNEARKVEEHFISVLAKEQYNNIKVEWDRLEKKGKYPKWYSLFNGPKSMRQLSKWCGYEAEYELLYGLYSRQVHSANAMDQFENVNGLAGIKNLRVYEDPILEILFSLRLGIESLKKIVVFFELDNEINIDYWERNILK
ncbi:DUF5677 domain-containing protein [Virgibacillus halodenitrificans]|uniref:DUF5677 domain-containing protein n=1 Tax=Virgibacillus halodenitrificans TaxID=1482 RepID=UPI0002FED9D7|nr:DUF5677 domain-containing protein [Virgibacillus halodenitrificans]